MRRTVRNHKGKFMKWHAFIRLVLCSFLSQLVSLAYAEEPEVSSLTIAANAFNSKTTGQAEDKAWNLTQNGQIDCVVHFPVSNAYTFIIVARGEPAADVWPQLRITLDGRSIFQGSVDSPEWIPYTFSETVEAGFHEISVAFINDLYQPPQDRNLQVSDLTITAPTPGKPPVQLTEKEFERFKKEQLRKWVQKADQEIDRVRKGKLVAWVTDEKDNAITNATVKVTQTQHEFPFGTALSSSMFETSAPAQEVTLYLENAKKLFNCAVTENAMKWTDMEPEENRVNYEVLDRMAAWCASNQMPLRGHCLFWGCHYPEWVTNRTDEALLQSMESRAVQIANRYATSIAELDVINEPMHCPYFSDRLGNDIVKKIFEWTREANPVSTRYVNDYNILNEGEADAYVDFIRNNLNAGVGISGIGVQAHFNGEADPFRITRALDALAQFKLPIKITEFDCDSTNEATRIQCLQTVYRAAFAHPAVKGILMWGFWEKAHWLPHSAILRKDFSKTPMAETYEKLIFQDWWTRAEGKTDTVGRYECTAFFGSYDVEIHCPGRKSFRTTVNLPSLEGAAILTAKLLPTGKGDEESVSTEEEEDYDQPVGR
jgi:endo-1,4-beta-xylanase